VGGFCFSGQVRERVRPAGRHHAVADPTGTDQTDTDSENDRPMTQRPESADTASAYRVAVVGGDGIGPEVVAEAMKVVGAAGVRLATTEYDLGAGRYVRTGEVLPDAVLDELRAHDAILLGAVGPPLGDTTVPSGLLERGLLLRLRFALDLYVNLRPFRAVPGSIAAARRAEPAGGSDRGAAEHAAGRSVTDLVVVRENTEGPYAGDGGALRRGTPHEVATQGSVNTRMGAERCARFAFDLAGRRPPGSRQLTLVHKTNVLEYAGDLWRRTVAEVAEEHPAVPWDYHHVDAACIHLVERPERYDVIVTDNLFGDILTDLAGAVFGGIGYAASANLNPARTGPSLFEPVHGAAHDIVGTGLANPIGAISSAALMLEHLGEVAAADRIAKAVEDLLAQTARGDATGTTAPKTTAAIGDAIAERL
jgi:3-isopropylmalate dehydrogenase